MSAVRKSNGALVLTRSGRYAPDMRPTCIAVLVALSAMIGGCAAAQRVKSSFTDSAAACIHAQTVEPLERIKQPCLYAEALAMCIELPKALIDELTSQCEKQRDMLLKEVIAGNAPVDVESRPAS